MRAVRRTVPRKARQSGDFYSLRILTTIYIPLARPALLTITVFTFIATWNNLRCSLLHLHDEKLYMLPLDLMQFIGVAGNAQGTPWHLVMAISNVMMLPAALLFFLAQRRFIEVISATRIKG